MKNKSTKTNKTNKSTLRINERVVTKGVYQYPSGTYVVRPIVKGKQMRVTFTNLKAAKAYYNKTINS